MTKEKLETDKNIILTRKEFIELYKKSRSYESFKDDPKYVRKCVIKEYEELKKGNRQVSAFMLDVLGDIFLPLYPKVFDVYIELLDEVEQDCFVRD